VDRWPHIRGPPNLFSTFAMLRSPCRAASSASRSTGRSLALKVRALLFAPQCLSHPVIAILVSYACLLRRPFGVVESLPISCIPLLLD